MSQDRKRQLVGVALIAMAALIWGWNGPVSKGLSTSVDVLSIIFLRTVIAILGATPIFLFFDRSVFHVSFKQFLFLFFYGSIIVSGTTVGFFCALQYLSVSSALLLHYSFPILTMIGSSLLIKEAPNNVQISSALLILLGVWFGVHNSPDQTGQIPIQGILWGLLAVVGISLQTLCGRIASFKGSVSQLTLLYHGFLWSIFSVGLHKTLTIGWGDIAHIKGEEWALIVAIGIIGSLLAHFLYLMGLKRVTASLGSLVSSLELVAAAAFGVFILNEIPMTAEIIGSIIVIFAITISSIAPEKTQIKIRKAA